MSATVDQHIERVDGTLCMKTTINLSRTGKPHLCYSSTTAANISEGEQEREGRSKAKKSHFVPLLR